MATGSTLHVEMKPRIAISADDLPPMLRGAYQTDQQREEWEKGRALLEEELHELTSEHEEVVRRYQERERDVRSRIAGFNQGIDAMEAGMREDLPPVR